MHKRGKASPDRGVNLNLTLTDKSDISTWKWEKARRQSTVNMHETSTNRGSQLPITGPLLGTLHSKLSSSEKDCDADFRCQTHWVQPWPQRLQLTTDCRPDPLPTRPCSFQSLNRPFSRATRMYAGAIPEL